MKQFILPLLSLALLTSCTEAMQDSWRSEWQRVKTYRGANLAELSGIPEFGKQSGWETAEEPYRDSLKDTRVYACNELIWEEQVVKIDGKNQKVKIANCVDPEKAYGFAY